MANLTLGLFDGDPETPNWPSLDGVYRIPEEERNKLLPHIPCQPIGYRGAKELLKHLKGTPVPESWKGGIENIDYVIGGNEFDDCPKCYVK